MPILLKLVDHRGECRRQQSEEDATERTRHGASESDAVTVTRIGETDGLEDGFIPGGHEVVEDLLQITRGRGSAHQAPRLNSTVGTVRNRISRSSHTDQESM